MKIMVIGANGQLGWEVCRKADKNGYPIVALDLPEFDITDPLAVQKGLTQDDISLVINTAAYTAVDQAESEPERAFAINCVGPAYLASQCAEKGIPLLHLSTDYVFDGTKKGPYLEADPVSPLGVYGKSKAAGEEKVRSHLREHIILRTAWLYGIYGHNFVKTMLRLGKEKELVRVVSDQYGSPTYTADLADAILTMATQIYADGTITWGTYHYCGEGVTTWHGFTQAIFDLAKHYISLKVKRVEPITTAEYPTPAKRPPNSALNCSLIEQHFCISPRPWPESLAHMLRAMFHKQSKYIQHIKSRSDFIT